MKVLKNSILAIAFVQLIASCAVVERSMEVGIKVSEVMTGEMKKDVKRMKKRRLQQNEQKQ